MSNRTAGRLAALAAGAALALAPAAAHAARFSRPLKLPDTPPKGAMQGGEPSVAFDTDGADVYVVSPGGGSNGGVNFWRSRDGARSFPKRYAKTLGSSAGGGDSDVSVGPDDTLYVADLEVFANAVCRSYDKGRTFDEGCDQGQATNQAGPDSDREWVVPSPRDPETVFLTYHDFATETPLAYASHAQGDPGTFLPCGPVLTPGGDAFANYIPGGTNVGKPLAAPDGSFYIPIVEPTNPALLTTPYNSLYMAIARHACGLTTPFQDVEVYSNPKASVANIFPYVTEDGGGTIYAEFTGQSGRDGSHYGVYVFRSADKGETWSQPVRIDDGKGATALGSIAGGPKAGQLVIGYYESRNTQNPDSARNRWDYVVATTRNGGRTVRRRTVTTQPIHYGQVCTQGILCTGGRNLLDFSSVGVNPKTGCAVAVFAGDPFDTPQNGRTDEAAAYVSRQTGGCF